MAVGAYRHLMVGSDGWPDGLPAPDWATEEARSWRRYQATGIREVLVGVGHGSGGPELVWAADEAAHTSSRLTICHVCSSGTGCRVPRPGPSCAHPPETRVVRLLGDPAIELARLSHRASHLVVGASGYYGPSSVLRPATATRVIEHASSSVTVVCPHLSSGRGALAGYVVAGVDHRGGSREVLAYAADYAIGHRLPLALVNVPDRDPGQQTQELLRVSGAARLLVLGSDRTGGRGAGPGSLARTVVAHANCPVAVVHHR